MTSLFPNPLKGLGGIRFMCGMLLDNGLNVFRSIIPTPLYIKVIAPSDALNF